MLAVADEFEDCHFGDLRLTKRLKALVSSISENPEICIHAACGSASESKAAYRFFQNENVSPEGILKGHIKNTQKRISEIKDDILIVQDTTDLIYTQFLTISDIGERLKAKGYETRVKGLMLYSSVAVTKSGVPLGLLKQFFFTHDDYPKKKRLKSNKHTRFE